MQTLPYNPIHINMYGLGCSPFARRYSGNRKNLLPERNGALAPTFRTSPERDAKASVQKESSIYCFLFLQVLRCFTSLRTLPHTRVPADDRRVSPFGHFRIKGYLAPPRNLSQPYHVLHRFLKPRHPPYTLRSHRERYTPLYNFLSVGRRYILRPVSLTNAC